MLTGVPLFLLQLVVILASAVLLGRLASRFGQPAIVGELAAGILLGPSVLGKLAPEWAEWLPRPGSGALIDAVAQLGLLLLVGLSAAELDLGRLREQAGTLARVSAWGLILPLGLGAAAGFLAPAALMGPGADRGTFAAFLGVALSVTAIPVISRTLADLRLLGHRVGQITLASGACQDAVAWILLTVVGALATSGGGPGTLGMPLLWLAVMVLAALALRPFARRVLSAADQAPAMTTSAVVILTGALAAHLAGLEPVVGAFVAGLVAGAASGEGARHLAGLRTAVIAVLAPVFLAFAGLHLDLAALAEPVVALSAAGLLTLAVAGKLAGGYIGARTSGLPRWESFAIGAGLNSRGLVEIVVATVGLQVGILTPAAYSIVVLIAVATSLMAPPLLRAALRRAPRPEQNGERHGRGESERDQRDLHRPGHR
ncbi:cation:proton antiporter [Nonomuraea sp. NPDC049649]|uniref:cation:proton antiporter n=1 Tax=Nonomuraea sp. NPDC049649 TaxID=3155776 RepID=UPI003449EABD